MGSAPMALLGSGGLQLDKVLVGGWIVECGMRSLVVIEERIVGQCGLHRFDAQGAVVQAPELDAGAAVGAFHAALVLGAPGHQHIQGEVEVLTGLFEVRHELAGAVHLDRAQRERQGLQAASGQCGLPAIQRAPADLQLLQGAGLAAARGAKPREALQLLQAQLHRRRHLRVYPEALAGSNA